WHWSLASGEQPQGPGQIRAGRGTSRGPEVGWGSGQAWTLVASVRVTKPPPSGFQVLWQSQESNEKLVLGIGADGFVRMRFGGASSWALKSSEPVQPGSTHRVAVVLDSTGAMLQVDDAAPTRRRKVPPGRVPGGEIFLGGGEPAVDLEEVAWFGRALDVEALDAWWTRPTNAPLFAAGVLASEPGPVGWELSVNGQGRPVLAYVQGDKVVRQLAQQSLRPGAWNHLAVAVDEARWVRFYVNGESSGEADLSEIRGSLVNDASLRIGRDRGSRAFHGRLWRLRLHEEGLVPADLLALQRERYGEEVKLTGTLAAAWEFDSPPSSQVPLLRDVTGRCADGWVHGVSWAEGPVGRAIQFEGSGEVEIPDVPESRAAGGNESPTVRPYRRALYLHRVLGQVFSGT
ncbi:MAG: hypothetical protein QGG40_21595, partial [Myxococcota bacterium]|nr:hypothetical protein [Myxococcota bacterium]